MLNDRRKEHYRRLILTYLAVLFVGWLFGAPLIVFCAALVTHVIWSQIQMHRLLSWLHEFEDGEPPRAKGAWGDVLDSLWTFRRRQRTEVRKLQNSLQRVQRTVESLADGLVIITPKGEIQWWNEAAQNMLNLRASDEGQALTNLIRDPHFVEFFNKNREHVQFVWHSPRTGSYLQFTNNRHAAGNRLLMVRDISRLRQLEQMRQDFVANASHELRTPLTVLQGYLETFADLQDGLPERLRKGVDLMLAQSKRMANLVNDLLLLTRLDGVDKPVDAKPVDIAALIHSIIVDAQALSGENQHEFAVHIDSPMLLLGVDNELRSAFSNLVYNSVHYTPPASLIELRWRHDDAGGYFSVTDNGVGIDQKHIPRLTERFYRVDVSRSSSTGGTGLGLAIVKHVLMHHGARLDIDSKLRQGSTFTCCFPPTLLTEAKSSATD
ncbi:phosphate regulon sensor histidine kinase PhoR [Salinispirillum sp. LH 10-3-1]|uniref:Phosphate regulon sensor protein PhoR n=1 Tax=Salinispirillum sp. LH 10-3-1 TaxID=2952525 RepID=A0AB38YGE5_9GAMM